MCLTVYGLVSAYSPVGVWSCALGGPSQHWTYTAAQELRLGDNLCMALVRVGAAQIPIATLAICDGSTAQRWVRP